MQFYKRISSFPGKFLKILIFQAIKKIDFPSKQIFIYSYLWQIILFLFKSNHFRTYFLYLIRYNDSSRPVHDPCDPHTNPLPKIWGRDPQPPGLTPLDSNGKEAFSRRNELPMGGLRSMNMPQEKNDENTDLKCDLVLCRNMDSEKEEHHKKISWTEHISNEVLKLVEEERSLLTIIRTRQRNWMRHIMTGDSIQREIIERRMAGKRGRGRPRKNYWTG